MTPFAALDEYRGSITNPWALERQTKKKQRPGQTYLDSGVNQRKVTRGQVRCVSFMALTYASPWKQGKGVSGNIFLALTTL